MKQFLASVGEAKLFGRKDGKLKHIANVKTLTEAGLNFSVESEEVRAGTGATLIGKFFHNSSLDITLSDIMWDMNYLSYVLGDDDDDFFSERNGLFTEDKEITSPTIMLSKLPMPIGNSCGLNKTLIWIKEAGCNSLPDIKAIEVEGNSRVITIPACYTGKRVCLEYFVSVPQARAIKVSSRFTPLELVLILTVKLFAGDTNSPESGKPIGEVTFKFPRFLLNGELELVSNMQSAAQTQLKGRALAVNSGECDGNNIYAEIVDIRYNDDSGSGLVALLVDPETVVVGGIPVVYGQYRNGTIAIIPFEDCTFNPEIDEDVGLVAGVTYTVTVGNVSETFGISMDLSGNPLSIISRFGANEEIEIDLYDNMAPIQQNQIVHQSNISFISGNTTLSIVGNPESSDYYDYTSDEIISLESGNYTVEIGN